MSARSDGKEFSREKQTRLPRIGMGKWDEQEAQITSGIVNFRKGFYGKALLCPGV